MSDGGTLPQRSAQPQGAAPYQNSGLARFGASFNPYMPPTYTPQVYQPPQLPARTGLAGLAPPPAAQPGLGSIINPGAYDGSAGGATAGESGIGGSATPSGSAAPAGQSNGDATVAAANAAAAANSGPNVGTIGSVGQVGLNGLAGLTLGPLGALASNQAINANNVNAAAQNQAAFENAIAAFQAQQDAPATGISTGDANGIGGGIGSNAGADSGGIGSAAGANNGGGGVTADAADSGDGGSGGGGGK